MDFQIYSALIVCLFHVYNTQYKGVLGTVTPTLIDGIYFQKRPWREHSCHNGVRVGVPLITAECSHGGRRDDGLRVGVAGEAGGVVALVVGCCLRLPAPGARPRGAAPRGTSPYLLAS
jgi:hypothetical protein